MSAQTIPSISELRWRCRRGMLELDLILGEFLDQHFSELSPGDQRLFIDFLAEDDPVLFAWLLGHGPVESKYSDLVKKISQ